MTDLAALASGSNSTSSLSDITPGLLGFLVVAALAVALVFLLRSMNKQFRKLGPKPSEAAGPDGTPAAPAKPLRGLAAHRAMTQAAAEAAAEPEQAGRP